MNIEDFKPNDLVRYIPGHAAENPNHPDCEDGIVTSCSSSYVFVRYGSKQGSEATNPADLIKRL